MSSKKESFVFERNQIFPINTGSTTSLYLSSDTLILTSTYPPTLSLFNLSNYNLIFKRQIDYEIQKIRKYKEKIICLSNNFLEFHTNSRFIERISTKSSDFCFNKSNGKIYTVGDNFLEEIDFIKNMKYTLNSNNKKLYNEIKVSGINGLSYLFGENETHSFIELRDFRTKMIHNENILSKKVDDIQSFCLKDGVKFFTLSDKNLIEYDLRSDKNNVLETFDIKGSKNLKYFDDLGLFFNNSTGVYFVDKMTYKTSKVLESKEIHDFCYKNNNLYVGTDDSVEIYTNKNF